MAEGSVEEAVENYRQAILAIDMAALMATLTPEALAKVMTLQAPGIGPSSALERCEYEQQVADGGEYVYHFTLEGAGQRGTIMTRWKEIDGAWKISDIDLVQPG